MKKFYISLASIFFSVLAIIIIFFAVLANQENKYSDTYYGELENKTQRLNEIEGNKIVFIGGSSLSFGIKSKEMEAALGIPVVSYGLYASLGTKVMMELATPSIKKGDIVILSPEISKETYSTQMNYNNILKCFEGNQLYQRLAFKYRLDLLYYYPGFQMKKMHMETPEQAKPYTKDSFDSYGEIYDDLRSQNIMYDYYDSSLLIEPSGSLFTTDFIDYLNQYNDKINSLGATMYFAYSPTNHLAYQEDNVNEYNQIIKNKLKFKSLGEIEDYIYNEYYFYDTNFHLNSAGAYLHSKRLTDKISQELNIEIKKEIEVPSMPIPLYEKGDSITVDSVSYTKTKMGYFVDKVDENYKKDTIEIPKEIFATPVKGISDNAFSNLVNVKEIILPESIESLGSGCFSGSTLLTKVYLNSERAPLVPQDGLFDGANSNLYIYVPKAKLRLYTSGYSWTSYLEYLKTY